MTDTAGTVKLANESALGVCRFTWQFDGQRAEIQWGAGMTGPLAFLGGRAMPVTRPERFGWATPHGSGANQLRQVRRFAQAFADALAADDGKDTTADD